MSSTKNSNTNYIIIIESGKPDESSKGKSYRRLIPSIMYWLEGIGLPASEVGDSDSTTSLDHSRELLLLWILLYLLAASFSARGGPRASSPRDSSDMSRSWKKWGKREQSFERDSG